MVSFNKCLRFKMCVKVSEGLRVPVMGVAEGFLGSHRTKSYRRRLVGVGGSVSGAELGLL